MKKLYLIILAFSTFLFVILLFSRFMIATVPIIGLGFFTNISLIVLTFGDQNCLLHYCLRMALCLHFYIAGCKHQP